MENNKAEVKPFKVGEALTDNADGNTEPSILENSSRACVETRRRVCIKCNNVIIGKYRSAKFCSTKCGSAYRTYKWMISRGKFKKPGVGSGGNQEGKDNHQYKFGIGTYRKLALTNKPNLCNRCGKTPKRLEVHHIDEDRTNNELHNLEILCPRCHRKHHEHRDALGRYTKV